MLIECSLVEKDENEGDWDWVFDAVCCVVCPVWEYKRENLKVYDLCI